MYYVCVQDSSFVFGALLDERGYIQHEQGPSSSESDIRCGLLSLSLEWSGFYFRVTAPGARR